MDLARHGEAEAGVAIEAPGAQHRERKSLSTSVCRVRPDLPAVERVFDYLVPDELAAQVHVGTVVRVPLHGRRVRGWVVAVAVETETDPARLRPLGKIVGMGPPAELVALAEWAAWRWCGPSVAFLRAATPSLIVPLARDFGSSPRVRDPARSTSLIVPLARDVGSSPRVRDPARSTPPIVPLARDVGPSSQVRDAARSTYPHGHDGGGVRVHVWPPSSPRAALVESLVADAGSTIVVLPDGRRIGTLARALRMGGRRVAVLRAADSASVRTAAWRAALEGDCVVVGGRIAVWAPVPDLGAIVVLDEGDEALKEERAPTWHARDVAVERARRRGARVELVSPAPTVDAEAAATRVRRPPRPSERAGWPMLEVVDRREEPPGVGLLTLPLGDALRRALMHGGRAVCVLNRKGRARLLACVACGELARCEACGAAVAEADDGTLSCPRCATVRPKICLHCHGTRMKAVRPGIAHVRDELGALLPRARVVEVDAATTEIGPADVLVGTEAVLHRVPPDRARPVHLAAFLDFDQELLAHRVRAAEQALWLLVRAARLVGDRAGPGRLLVQTRVPDHEVIAAVSRGDPAPAIDAERARRRRTLGYPPFAGLAAVSGAAEAVDAVIDGIAARRDAEAWGPVPEGAGAAALVRAADVAALCDTLAAVIPAARSRGRLRVDVDPLRV